MTSTDGSLPAVAPAQQPRACVLFPWLAADLFFDRPPPGGAAAVHWLAEPPVPFLRDDACNGNFYETKFRSAVRRFN